MSEARQAKVLVAGGSGYAGALAAQLVSSHPHLELAAVTSRSDAGRPLKELYPQYEVEMELTELDLSNLGGFDAAIVAYPHGASAPVVAALREAGVKVVDLSADFRLRDLGTYKQWYGEHTAPELIAGAVYGLTELYREQIAGAELVANPGCYPTATLLALAPLAEAGMIEDVVVDAKSGISGAGRESAAQLASVVAGDDTVPYKVAGHRHAPEIAQELAAMGANGAAAGLTFVPHLMPYETGELVSCYLRPSRPVDAGELASLYADRYTDEAFVEISDEPPGVGAVRDTNLCRIQAVAAGERILAFAAIDNLWKGAASQAIQNLNLMLGLPEGEGVS